MTAHDDKWAKPSETSLGIRRDARLSLDSKLVKDDLQTPGSALALCDVRPSYRSVAEISFEQAVFQDSSI